MAFDPKRHHRRSIRLKGYDYSRPGAYFVTICTQGRVCLFGDVVNGQMVVNGFGQAVQDVWNGLPDHYGHVVLDEFVVMPNHVHGVILLVDDADQLDEPGAVGAGLKPAPTAISRRHGLPEIVRALQTFSARRINESRETRGRRVWQRDYYEHIIRDDESLFRIRRYIRQNPMRWSFDRENPNRTGETDPDAW